MADGCGGQNKNIIFVSMVMYWFSKYAPANIEDVCLIFPVTGHSFIPPDRVFGQIEREVKRHEMILDPDELITIIANVGEVIQVSQSVNIYDFKSCIKGVIKQTQSWPFQISKVKRIMLKRKSENRSMIKIKGEPYYYHDVANYTSVCIRKKNLRDICLTEVAEGNSLKKEKKNDVEKLLKKHFGDDWRTDNRLKFYVKVLDGVDEIEDMEAENVDDPPCVPRGFVGRNNILESYPRYWHTIQACQKQMKFCCVFKKIFSKVEFSKNRKR